MSDTAHRSRTRRSVLRPRAYRSLVPTLTVRRRAGTRVDPFCPSAGHIEADACRAWSGRPLLAGARGIAAAASRLGTGLIVNGVVLEHMHVGFAGKGCMAPLALCCCR
jgi:hypothetical protein